MTERLMEHQELGLHHHLRLHHLQSSKCLLTVWEERSASKDFTITRNMQQPRVGTTIIHRTIIFVYDTVYDTVYYDYTTRKPSRRHEDPGET